MTKHLYYLLVYVVVFASCKREVDEIAPVKAVATPTQVVQPPTAPTAADTIDAFLRSIKSTRHATEYISGEFNGYPIYLAADSVSPVLALPVFRYDPANGIDVGCLQFNNTPREVLMSVSIFNTDVFHRTLPFTWPHPNPAYCEQFWLRLDSQLPNGSPIAQYLGSTAGGTNGVTVIITSVKNNMIEGTFEGKIRQLAVSQWRGPYIEVRKGKFRKKVQVVNW